MYISRIRLQKFRNFKDLDVDLGPTAVIVGENKVGKSNLLYALRLVLDPSLPDSNRRLRAEDFWDGLTSPLAGHEICVTIELSGFDASFDASLEGKAVLADCVVSQSPLVARLTYVFRPKPGVVLTMKPILQKRTMNSLYMAELTLETV